MKFTKGYWLNRDGVASVDTAQIREVLVENYRVYLYAVPYAQDRRGIGGPVLELYISSSQPNIIRTEVYHFKGDARKYPKPVYYL